MKQNKITLIFVVLLIISFANLMFSWPCMRGGTGCHEIMWCTGEASSECDFFCTMLGSSCKRYNLDGDPECGPGDCICYSDWELECYSGDITYFYCGEYDDFGCGFPWIK